MNRLLFCYVLIFAVCVDGLVSSGQDATVAPVKPGLNDSFLDPELDIENWIQRFEVESREIYQAREEILQHMHLRGGERIADIGSGTGLFVPLLANSVGDNGWVYAVDIAPRFVEHIAKRINEGALSRVTPVICTRDSVSLPPESIDAAFICDVYHHFEFPEKTLASLHQALRPEGNVFIVDFERIPGKSRDWVLDHVRAGKQTVIDEMQSAGFELVAEREIATLVENYFLEFRRTQTSSQ